jgi:hypothetical protein
MTTIENRVFIRGLAAGVMIGLTFGLISALFIVLRPEVFAALVR